MAALLHDIGKPATTKIIEEQITSKGHEEVGSEIAEAIMKRLKFDNDATGRVKKIVRNHMRPHSLSGAGPKALRKFIRDVGDELVESVLNLARADELGKIPASNDIPDLKKRIEEIKTRVNITKKPVLNGDEIMELLKIPTGTEVGRAKKFLIDLEDDYAEKDKTLSKEEAREELLKEFHKKVALSDVLRSIIIN
jgi:putative nucleotidyltransferase with HDIG domain